MVTQEELRQIQQPRYVDSPPPNIVDTVATASPTNLSPSPPSPPSSSTPSVDLTKESLQTLAGLDPNGQYGINSPSGQPTVIHLPNGASVSIGSNREANAIIVSNRNALQDYINNQQKIQQGIVPEFQARGGPDTTTTQRSTGPLNLAPAPTNTYSLTAPPPSSIKTRTTEPISPFSQDTKPTESFFIPAGTQFPIQTPFGVSYRSLPANLEVSKGVAEKLANSSYTISPNEKGVPVLGSTRNNENIISEFILPTRKYDAARSGLSTRENSVRNSIDNSDPLGITKGQVLPGKTPDFFQVIPSSESLFKESQLYSGPKSSILQLGSILSGFSEEAKSASKFLISPAYGAYTTVKEELPLMKDFITSPVETFRNMGTSIGENPTGFIGKQLFYVGLGEGIRAPGYKISNLEISPLRGSVGDTAITGDAISGIAQNKAVGRVTYKYGPFDMLSKTETVPVDTNLIFQGQRIPESNLFGVRVESQTGIPTRAGTQYAPADYAGIYNANTNVLALRSPEGQLYFVQGGKSSPAFFDTVSSIEKAPARYMTLQTNEAGIPRVTNTGRISQLTESQAITKVPIERVGIGSEVPGQEAIIQGVPRERTQVSSQSLVRERSALGGNTDLFKGGFQNLERTGLYKNPEIVQTPFFEDRLQQQAQSFLQNRKGQIALTEEPNILGSESVQNIPPESVLKPARQFDLTGLPPGKISTERPVVLPTVFIPPSSRQNDIVKSRSSALQNIGISARVGTSTIQSQLNATRIAPITESASGITSAQNQGQESAFRFAQSTNQAQTQQQSQIQTVAQSFFTPGISPSPNILSPITIKEELIPPPTEENRRKKSNVQEILKKAKTQAFLLQIKRKGKFVTEGKDLTRGEALSRGQKITTGDLSATFRLVKEPGVTVEENGVGGSVDKSIFRYYAVVKGRKVPLPDTYIQRRGKRLVSHSEVSQLLQSRRSKRGGFL